MTIIMNSANGEDRDTSSATNWRQHAKVPNAWRSVTKQAKIKNNIKRQLLSNS